MKAIELAKLFPNKKRNIDDLARYLANRSQEHPNYCLLIGAGASVTSGVRSAGELVEEWRRDIFNQLNPDIQYTTETAKKWLSENQSEWYNQDIEYACLFERKFDLQSQRRMFVEQEVDNVSPSIGYAYLTNLVKTNHINTIFTTNFDDLLNEAFFRFTDIRPYICAHDSSVKGMSITSRRPKIIKLHGDYLFDNLKCTSNDINMLEKNMEEKLGQFLREYGLIVAGYSGCDKSVMSLLSKLIKDNDFLNNGVYWCLRENDEISSQLVDLMNNERIFFLYIEGFDELAAELNEKCCKDEISFIQTGVLARSLEITNKWLECDGLKKSTSPIVQHHLKEISKHKKDSTFANAITKFVRNEDDSSSSKLNDKETLIMIELNSMMSRRNFKQALNKIEEIMPSVNNNDLKEELLNINYEANRSLNRWSEAKIACNQLITLDYHNPVNYIKKMKVTKSIKEKITLIDEAISRDEYFWASFFEKAKLLELAMRCGEIHKSNEHLNNIDHNYQTSLLRRPQLSNPAWESRAKFLIKHRLNGYKEKVLAMIEALQNQDKYSPTTNNLLFLICKEDLSENIDSTDSNKINIFDYLSESLEKYYPKDHSEFWEIIVDSSIEFNKHSYAKEKIDVFLEKNVEIRDPSYHVSMAEYYFEINKDLDKAVNYIKNCLTKNENPALLEYYIELALFKNEIINAREELEKYKHVLDQKAGWNLESQVLLSEGKYEEAAEALENIRKEDEYFDTNYGSALSFIYLRSGNHQKAYDYCNQVLNNVIPIVESLYPLRINYEFSKIKLQRKPNKAKLSELENISKEKDIVAVANLLLGDREKCLEILEQQIGKRYSKLYTYTSWPVLESVKAELYKRTGSAPIMVSVDAHSA